MKKLMACLALTPLYAFIFWGLPYLIYLMVEDNQGHYFEIVRWFHIIIIGVVLFFFTIMVIAMLTSWAMDTLKGEEKIKGLAIDMDEDD